MKSRKKGQVEFIVILALIIIAIVAIVLASRQAVITPPTTSGITEEAKTIKDSVINLIRAGVKDQITLIYSQGGTLDPGFSVEFGMFDTAVWSACGETNIPDVSKEIGKGLWAYLRGNLEDEMEFYGKNVKFDFSDPRYDVDIYKDRINIKIYLSTTVEDLEIQQPYEVSIASKLYDVMEFSENFVKDAGEARFFETVTLTSMMHSNPEHENWVPVAGMRMGCGDVLMKSRNDILPGIKGIIKYTVSHVVWNTRALRIAENPFYPIDSVGGKTYPGLEVAFAYPPSWDSEIDKYFMFSSGGMADRISVIPKPIIPLIPFCMGPYSVAYSFRYPVVVMVEDSTLNQWFKFAVMVDIHNTQPGNCSVEFGEESEYSRICGNAECDARITVKNTTGSPIEGVDVSFYICDLGVTDSSGVVEGKIPCLVSELSAYEEGYRSFGDLYRSDELVDKTITMKKISDSTTIHFRALQTDGNGGNQPGTDEPWEFSSYDIEGDPEDVVNNTFQVFDKNISVFATFSPKNPNYFTGEDTTLILSNSAGVGTLANEITTVGLQPIEYEVIAIANSDDEEKSMPLGFINSTVALDEASSDIYIYIPVVLDVDEPGVNINQMDDMTEAVVTQCGYDPVGIEEHTSC